MWLGRDCVALGQAGFETHGVEESKKAVDLLRNSYPDIVWHHKRVDSFLAAVEPSAFDVITLFHVMEHLSNPREICGQITRTLKPNGLLVVEVPDVSGGQARLRGWGWQHWLPHHVNYFNRRTLCRLLEPLGFKLHHVEFKYHLGFPQGIWWRDWIHDALARFGLHDIITTY